MLVPRAGRRTLLRMLLHPAFRLLPRGASRRAASVLAAAYLAAPLELVVGAPLHAQSAEGSVAHSVAARRLGGAPPAIDGRLDEEPWRAAPDVPASTFSTTRPVAGGAPSLRTTAWVRFDDEALWVAVRAFDPRPDSIVAPFLRRDDESTADWIFVEIDSRHDRRSGFSFGLDPRGVQVDGAWANDVDYDASWNGVWEGAARIDSSGWAAEFRIPFTQLTLPAGRAGTPITLGLNVYRAVPRRGESANSSPRPPIVAGVVSHFLTLTGVTLPPALHRVEVAPYLAMRAAHAPPLAGDAASAALPRGGALLGGADARLRLSPAATLTATLHPDFGQVEADPAVVNLTAFESFFPEQRPFFVEGAEMFAFHPAAATTGATATGGFGVPFSWRDVDLSAESPFYSRRIGRAPHDAVLRDPALAGRSVVALPAVSDVLGAAKLTGRTRDGWSVGALGAVADHASATVDGVGAVLAEPRTAFGVLRVARDFLAGRAALGAILTVTDRFGLDTTRAVARPVAALLARDAEVAGVDARARFGGAGETYEASGFVAASRLSGTPAAVRGVAGDAAHALLRADRATPWDTTRRTIEGSAGELRLAKLAGQWVWSVTGHAISPGFTSNDVGFQRSADWLLALGTLGYRHYTPGRWLRTWSLSLDQLGAGWSTSGERRGAVATASAAATLHDEWGGKVAVARELSALSFDALRGGPALLLPPRDSWVVSLYSDSRRPTQWTWAVRGATERDGGGVLGFNTSVDARLTDRVRVALATDLARVSDPRHFVGNAGGIAGCTSVATACPIVARLRQRTFTATARADVGFTAHTTLQLYAQPLVAHSVFDRYAAVVAPRAPVSADRTRALSMLPADLSDPSAGARSARATVVWRWEYRPGSTLYAVFSQQRGADVGAAQWTPGAGLRALASDPPVNVLLLKASYWWQP